MKISMEHCYKSKDAVKKLLARLNDRSYSRGNYYEEKAEKQTVPL